MKGQAYRSLDFTKENHYCDAIIAQVCGKLSVQVKTLGIHHEFTLWVDPYEVSLRVGHHVYPKDNQQLIVAQFDKEGNTRFQLDLDTAFSHTRLPSPRASPTHSLASSSTSGSGPSTPQRTSSPYPVLQPSLFNNGSQLSPPRALSPSAPIFEMRSSTPITIPFDGINAQSDENLSIDDNQQSRDRSDTPHSMHSTTSNESADSGYCGYVESYPYYYKLNRLYRALAVQKHNVNGSLMSKGPNSRRTSRTMHYTPKAHSSSPPTPTPANIHHWPIMAVGRQSKH